MKSCEVRENCRTFNHGKCWICEDYSLYAPVNKHILCQRQIRERERRKVERKAQYQTEAAKRGRAARIKGSRGENEIIHILAKYGIKAERVPLSGALKGSRFQADIICQINDKEKRIESKRRADGFKELYKHLDQDGADYVFMRSDRQKWIVAMYFDNWIELVGGEAVDTRPDNEANDKERPAAPGKE